MPLGLDELIQHWTVPDDERELIAGKRGRRDWDSRCC
jgi:hypothetical protein